MTPGTPIDEIKKQLGSELDRQFHTAYRAQQQQDAEDQLAVDILHDLVHSFYTGSTRLTSHAESAELLAYHSYRIARAMLVQKQVVATEGRPRLLDWRKES